MALGSGPEFPEHFGCPEALPWFVSGCVFVGNLGCPRIFCPLPADLDTRRRLFHGLHVVGVFSHTVWQYLGNSFCLLYIWHGVSLSSFTYAVLLHWADCLLRTVNQEKFVVKNFS